MNLKAIPGNLLGLFLAEKSAGALAAAIACGLFLGIAPVLSLQGLIVLAIVCFLRVNLSWTLITFAVFKGASVALGAQFDALGVTLLSNEGLQGLWTSLYHSPLAFLRTHEATSLGGTILAVLLSPVVYLVARMLIARRRAKLEAAGKPVPELPKSRFFRVGAMLPMTGIFLIAVGGVGMARDGIIHSAAVSSLQSAFSAKAEVFGVVSGLAMPKVELQNVQVADRQEPMKNLFQFQRMAGSVALVPLLNGRVHIPELALEGLQFGTVRTTSGALPGLDPLPEPEPDPPGPTFSEALDDLLKSLEPPGLEDLETVKEARAIEQEARALLEALQTKVKESTLPKRFKEAQSRVTELAKVEKPESFQAVESAARELAALRPDPKVLDAIRADFEAAVPDFSSEQSKINSARADFISAGAAAKRAQKLVTEAQKIEKATFQTALKITQLLNDLNKSQSALLSAAGKLDRARKNMVSVQESIQTRSTNAAARLQSGRTALADAQALLERAGGDLTAKTEALAGSLNAAKNDLEQAKSKAEAELARLAKDLEAARAEADALRTELEKGLKLAQEAPGRMEAALERDRKEFERRYNMDRLTSDELLAPVVGEETLAWLRWTLAEYERLGPLMSPSEEGEAAREQVKQVATALGTVFRFPAGKGVPPAFWVGRAAFSGTIDINGKPFTLTGEATGISSDLEASGADASITFTASYEGSSFKSEILVTRAGDAVITVEVEGVAIQGGLESPRLKAGFENGKVYGKIQVSVGASGVKASAEMKLDGIAVALAPDALDQRLAFLNDVLGELKTIEAKIGVGFGPTGFESFEIGASAGEGFRAGVKKALLGQVEAAKSKAFAEIDKRIAEPKAQALASAKAIAAKGGPAVEGLLAGLQGDQASVEAAGKAALGEYAKMASLLPSGDDPSAEIAAMQAQLATLTEQSGALEGQAKEATDKVLAAASSATKLGDSKASATKSVEAAVKKEIARLSKLR